ncbi:MAG: XamI family restriction endonuclease [Pseudomonadota bacterium]|nr:XamI family restriction endonuclease [Pseudomonadota bacterium]
MSDNLKFAKEATEVFKRSQDPNGERRDWIEAYRMSRSLIAQALRASSMLQDIPSALVSSGGHLRAFRYMLAPPLSQDRLAIVCSAYVKSKEKTGKPYGAAEANELANFIIERLDPYALAVRSGGAEMPRTSVRQLMNKTGALIANQDLQTVTRNRLSDEQERLTLKHLSQNGYSLLPPKQVSHRGGVSQLSLMHKAKLAISSTNTQEVDIAVGMKGDHMLALECKVSNDQTNSIKRVNDVIAKHHSWMSYWGAGFITTGALLQGVFSDKSIKKLEKEGIHIFWSHRISDLSDYVLDR